jgi:hypothetical protein
MSEQVDGSDGPAEMSDPSGRLERSADEFIEIFDVLLTGLDLKFSPTIPMCAVVARTVAERQVNALRASIVLGKNNLGQLASAFVRQACEEQIWLKYIAQLESAVADRLLSTMGDSDVMRGLLAFRDYAGLDALVKLGFPAYFVQWVDVYVGKAKSDFSELGDQLGWPNRKRPPSTDWIADQVGDRRTYDYLFAASSRVVHFSAGEAFRNTWWDAEMRLHLTEGRQNHQYAFALDCLILTALRTFRSVFVIMGSSSKIELDEDILLDAMRRYMELGRVPLMIPEEFNLRPHQVGYMVKLYRDCEAGQSL